MSNSRGPLRKSVLALGTALSLAGACQSSGEVTGGAVCTFGDRILCTGAGNCTGSAACLPDLSGYGDCECEADGAPPDGKAPPDDSGFRDRSADSG